VGASAGAAGDGAAMAGGTEILDGYEAAVVSRSCQAVIVVASRDDTVASCDDIVASRDDTVSSRDDMVGPR
jgi:hypothetical protein